MAKEQVNLEKEKSWKNLRTTFPVKEIVTMKLMITMKSSYR